MAGGRDIYLPQPSDEDPRRSSIRSCPSHTLAKVARRRGKAFSRPATEGAREERKEKDTKKETSHVEGKKKEREVTRVL